MKKYARRGRLDVVSKAVERMAQEVLVKQERNAWAVILKALSEGKGTGAANVTTLLIMWEATEAFQLDTLNAMITRMKRINKSFAGGTAAQVYSEGITDLYVSPEVKQDIRAFRILRLVITLIRVCRKTQRAVLTEALVLLISSVLISLTCKSSALVRSTTHCTRPSVIPLAWLALLTRLGLQPRLRLTTVLATRLLSA